MDIRVINNSHQIQNDLLLAGIVVGAQAKLSELNTYLRPVESDQKLDITLWDINGYQSIDITPRQNTPVAEKFPLLQQFHRAQTDVELTSGDLLRTYARAVELTVATSLYIGNQCDEAKPIFESIAGELQKEKGQSYSIDSTLSAIYFYQANCAIAKSDFETAIPQLEVSLELCLSEFREVTFASLGISYYLAWAYLQVGQENDAFSLLNRLVEETKQIPGSGDDYNDALINTAQIYALAEQYEQAIENLSIAIERFNGQLLYLFLLRAQMYLALYEWDSALADYNAALDLNLDYADAYYYRGVLYYSILQTGTNLRDDALADFRRYLDLDPTGEHTADAARYVEIIQRELDNLNN